MKLLKRFFFGLLAVLMIAIALLYVTGNEHILYGLRSTYLIGKSKPDIDDMNYFDVSTIKADKPEPWPQSVQMNNIALTDEELALHAKYESTAFLVFRNDSLLHEQYFADGSADARSNTFSMAKSFVSLMVGKAIEEGYIKSVNQKVSDFIPELEQGLGEDLTIKHLLQMSSGIPFGESYGNPFGFMAKAYFGKSLVEETLKFKVTAEPGTGWIYEGGNTILLGMIVARATGRSCSEYFHQKFWSCIGTEQDAYWNLDKPGGMEKVFSGFYATARDYGKIGRLMMHEGVLGSDTVISPAYMREAFTPCMVKDISPMGTGENCYWYGYQWWLGEVDGIPFYNCRGLRGQYVVAIPSLNLVMVRLGHTQSAERERHMPTDMIEWIRMARRIAS
jgi:CubicO group peptidase (beta-lactamase class C family)